LNHFIQKLTVTWWGGGNSGYVRLETDALLPAANPTSLLNFKSRMRLFTGF